MSALITLEGCAVLDEPRVAQLPILTDEHRRWLNAPERKTWLMKDVVLMFALKFRLTPFQTGKLLAAWCKELA